MKSQSKLSLKKVLSVNPWGFFIPTFLGVVASLAGVALLGISGWFLAGAGLAGVIGTMLVFNYLTPGALVRLMAILRTSGRYGEQIAAHNHLLGLLRSLRLWVWDQRVAKDTANLHKQSRGDLLQRIVADVDQIIRWPLVVLMPWIYGAVAYLAVAILAFLIQPVLLWPMVIAAFIHLVVIPVLCNLLAGRAVYTSQSLGIHRRGRFISLFSALVTLTIRGHWQDYAERLHLLDDKQKQAEVLIQKTISLGRFLGYIATIFLLASFFFLLGEFDLSDYSWKLTAEIKGTWLVALVLSILAVNELVLALAQSFVAQKQSEVGLHRLNQLHSDPTTEIKDIVSQPKELSFKHFRGIHPSSGLGNKAIDFDLKSGDSLWLTGPSGCGKSSLLAALAGELKTEGDIRINNDSIASLYGNESYQSFVSYLPQAPYIFQQSVAANVRLGAPDASDDDIMAVLDAVALGEWVRSLPNGLATLLGALGRDMSGGQRRRLALARLLLRKAPILLLDEPFDGLDKDTIAKIIQALTTVYKPQILVFVSHIETRLGQDARVLALE